MKKILISLGIIFLVVCIALSLLAGVFDIRLFDKDSEDTDNSTTQNKPVEPVYSDIGYLSSRVTIPETVAESHNILNYAYYSDSEYFFVNSAEGLLEVSRLTAEDGETFEGKTVYITKDIDMTGKTWTPIGVNFSTNVFRGEIDGLGHVIDNLVSSESSTENMDGSTRAMGFVGYAKGCTIKNLVLGSNSSFTYTGKHSDARMAAFIGTVMRGDSGSDTVVENCMNLADVTGRKYAAGFVGQYFDGGNGDYVKIINCTNVGDVTSEQVAGGFVGYCAGGLTMYNCRNAGTVTLLATDVSDYKAAGGFISRAVGSAGSMPITAEACVNNGVVRGGYIAGGFFGQVTKDYVIATDCSNYGLVTVNAEGGTASQTFGYLAEGLSAETQIVNCLDRADETDLSFATAELAKAISFSRDESPDEAIIVEPEAPVVLANYDVGYYVSGHTYDSNDSGSKIELTGFHSDFGYTPAVTLVESFEEGELTKYQTTLNVAKYADYTVVIKFYDAEGGFFASDSEEYKKSMKSYTYTSGEDTYKYVVLQYEDLQSDSLILFLSTNECKVEYYESLYVRIYGDNKTILVHKAHAVAGQASETEITVYDLAAGDRILTDVDTAVSGLAIADSATGTISEVYDDWTTGSCQEIVVQSVSSDGDSLTYGYFAGYEEAVEYADRAMIYLSEFSSELIPPV